MLINEIFAHISTNFEITAIHNDSRFVDNNSLFVAYTGFEVDVHQFIPDAYQRGCRYFMIDQSYHFQLISQFPDAEFIPSENLKIDSAQTILKFYQHPDQALCLIGITGTNGKTTTATLINQSLRLMNKKTAFFGTVEWSVGDQVFDAPNTTPDFLQLVKYLRMAVDNNIEYVVMEVASHALTMGRVESLNFDYALFTNLTQDHLDFHHTFEDYYKAKESFFTHLLANSTKNPKKAIINADDEYGQRLLKILGGRGIPAISLSLQGWGTWNAENIQLGTDCSEFTLVSQEKSIQVKSLLLGLINVQNMMMAIILLKQLSFNIQNILDAIIQVSIPGRLQKFTSSNGVVFLVDYAHTPDALTKAIHAVRDILPKNNKAIVVFGAGGDRDRAKRSLMAKASSDADIIVVTSDNPRTENPEQIIQDILQGFSSLDNVFHEIDRQKALLKAYQFAQSGDVVLVAGKGHEDYQIIGKTKYHFSDYEEIQKICLV